MASFVEKLNRIVCSNTLAPIIVSMNNPCSLSNFIVHETKSTMDQLMLFTSICNFPTSHDGDEWGAISIQKVDPSLKAHNTSSRQMCYKLPG
mmetsp:Transcript_25311/g.45605  ORF Transcript_25311/g.45605 Transcript_25311/m.45605 type:complete len:92 (+) Transcript_25311:99-374(+)